MKIICLILLTLLVGCTQVTQEELDKKISACAASGMDYTYLKDYSGKPYDVMCVARRLR